MKKADIGVIGLAVMGANLALNMASHGFTTAVYNRSPEKMHALTSREEGKELIGCETLQDFVDALEKPRRVFLMVKAGNAVDAMINELIPLLEAGDIIIDGGNSNYKDSIRRGELVASHGLLYMDTGVSGGEEGALKGPSIMPGGDERAWPYVRDIFRTICAHTEDGTACCEWISGPGSGHFTKMVHNGIEYGDMQLICEAYQIMREQLGMSAGEIQKTFASWNDDETGSYLIEITADIAGFKEEDGSLLLDHILDSAGQKGTGMWTGMTALEEQMPVTMITEAVFARNLSALKDERVKAAELYDKKIEVHTENVQEALRDLKGAVYAAKLVLYAQGFALIRKAAEHYGWSINTADVARIWKGGCIIRCAFLDQISEAYSQDAGAEDLLFSTYFVEKIRKYLPSWRRTAASAMLAGVPIPVMSSGLSYFDGLTCEKLPANLLQAQRDYFGAHTFERTDRPRGEFYHNIWITGA